jgi:hypothetical protein
MELVGRWWNGNWGRASRRDLWLFKDGAQWRVRARDGGDGGKELSWPRFYREHEARAWIQRLKKTTPGPANQWKDITHLVARRR